MSLIDDFRLAWSLPQGELPLPAVDFLDKMRDRSLGAGEDAFKVTAGPGSPFDIVGQYHAFIILDWLDAQIARDCLPSFLELAPPKGTPVGKHPVMYSFGFHRGVHPRFFQLWSYDYAEALLGLPCVNLRHSDRSTSGPYYYMTAVRLNNRFADEIGVALGFPKRMAFVEAEDTSYSIRMEPNTDLVMTGAFKASGGVFGSNDPHFRQVEQMVLQQPVISRSAVGTTFLTPFHVDTGNASMFPAQAEIRIADNSLAALPAGRYSFPGIDVSAFHSCYHSIHDWVMSPPKIVGI